MENIKGKEELSLSSNNNEEYINKYIQYNYIYFFNPDNLIEKENKDDLICPICYFILNNPINCSDKNISHSFCKECIDKYLKEHDKCPTCKLSFEYKLNNEINNELKKLSFKCMFKKEGCNDIISYSDYLDHINNCKYNNIKYECNIMKYNYKEKNFEKCGFIGGKKEIENHFKLCGLIKYQCIFCKEDILQIDLKEHVKNMCKFTIINYSNGNIYIGEKNNNLKEGYGIFNFINGDKYEGEWKNDLKEGYGIYNFTNGEKYEGEWKNDLKEGYGIYYFTNGEKYEGEWKNNLKDGHGIMFFADGTRFEGEWKNGL